MTTRFLVLFSFVVLSACGGGGSSSACGPTNCLNGCCDSTGMCQHGTDASACGNGGNTCSACTGGQVCGTQQVCTVSSGMGGGNGGSGGGSSGTGGGTTGTGGGTTGTGGGNNPGTGGGTTGTGGGNNPGTGGGTTGMGGGTTGTGGGTTMTRTVTGTRAITLITDTGTQQGTSSAPLRFLSETSGTFTSVSVTPVAGAFSVMVPPGPYYLEVPNGSVKFYVLTSASTLDLGQVQAGRIDGAYPTAATPLQLNLSGLISWDPNDSLSLASTNVGMAIDDVTAAAPSALTAGATSGSLTVDYNAYGEPLVSSARGDTLIVTQSKLLGSPVPYFSAAAAGTVTGLTQTSGMTSSAVVAMSALPTQSQSLDMRTTLFESYRTDVHPQAVAARTQALILGVPGLTATQGVAGSMPAVLYVPIAAGGTDLSGTFTYGNPYPSTIPLVFDVRSLFAVSMQAAGAASTVLYGSIGYNTPLATMSGAVIPRLSPPRDVKVNNLAATTPLSGVGASPVITWSAPTLGTADRYVLLVYRLVNQGGQTVTVPVATLRTKGTRMVLPPGVLTTGAAHAIVVSANMNGGIDVDTKPFTNAGITAMADTIIGPITP